MQWNPSDIDDRLQLADKGSHNYHEDLSVFVNPLAIGLIKDSDGSYTSEFERLLKDDKAKEAYGAFKKHNLNAFRHVCSILLADNVEEKLSEQDKAFMALDGSQSNSLVLSWASKATESFAPNRYGIIKELIDDARRNPDVITPVLALPNALYDLILNSLQSKRDSRADAPVVGVCSTDLIYSSYIVYVSYTRMLVEITSLITETNGSAVFLLKDLYFSLELLSTAFYKMIAYSNYNKNK
nr:MAG TPA: hypothetical protein [Caudoviricetes sp.]